jgi:hypothetical protein
MRINSYRRAYATLGTLLFLLMFALAGDVRLAAQTQDQRNPATSLPGLGNMQNADNLEVVPNRPTFSTTAETVMRGVFEFEYGFELARGHQNINALLKFGLFRNLEIRFGNNPIVRDDGSAGFGDSGAGFKYRFLKAKGVLPTLSILYTLTIPTATSGLGNGAVGHSAGLLVSPDFGRHHLDFNETIQWLGRDGSGGFDRNYFTALSYSHPIRGKLGFSEEIAGFSRTNATTGPTITILQALSYNIAPRLVLDGGCYVAPIGDLPRVTFFAGVTYAIGDLYRHMRHLPHGLPARRAS